MHAVFSILALLPYNEYPRAVRVVPQDGKGVQVRVAKNTVSRKSGARREKSEGRGNVQGSRKREEFHWGENVRRNEEFSPAARFSHVTIRQRNKYSPLQVYATGVLAREIDAEFGEIEPAAQRNR